MKEHFTAPRAQITSTGLTQADLEELIPKFELESGSGPDTVNAVFAGHELRVPNFKEYNTYVAVAGEAPGCVHN